MAAIIGRRVVCRNLVRLQSLVSAVLSYFSVVEEDFSVVNNCPSCRMPFLIER